MVSQLKKSGISKATIHATSPASLPSIIIIIIIIIMMSEWYNRNKQILWIRIKLPSLLSIINFTAVVSGGSVTFA